MKIRATVIDIRVDRPRRPDQMLVDTNVWFWATYPKAALINPTYANLYAGYLAYALDNQLIAYRCLLSLAELSHSIERNEWQEYLANTPNPISYKAFRRQVHQRQVISEMLEEVWLIVEMLSNNSVAPLILDDPSTHTFREHYPIYSLDGYDLLLLHAMQQAHLTQLITDDADFGQVADLHVFTANPYLIQQAAQQGRLITRPPDGV